VQTRVSPGPTPQGEEPRARPEPKVKSSVIDKRLIVEAWEKVRANNGAPGVDAVGIGLFAGQLRDNLYKLWNRMSSGSYFPGPVRGVEIPKDHGEGVRLLGVPSTADRVAQTAAAMLLEQKLEPVFHCDSYGYRPGRSAHDALAVCRRRCWAQDWVLDLDVRAFSGLRSAFSFAEGGRSPHQRAVGLAVHLAVAESADADARWDRHRAGERDSAGFPDFAPAG
jgi:Reverse transcriptase (RNA-dependent DNA polymerase)